MTQLRNRAVSCLSVFSRGLSIDQGNSELGSYRKECFAVLERICAALGDHHGAQRWKREIWLEGISATPSATASSSASGSKTKPPRRQLAEKKSTTNNNNSSNMRNVSGFLSEVKGAVSPSSLEDVVAEKNRLEAENGAEVIDVDRYISLTVREGLALRELGRVDDARVALERGLILRRRALARRGDAVSGYAVAAALLALANLENAVGDHDEAERLAVEVLGAEHLPSDLRWGAGLALSRADAGRGRHESALRYITATLPLAQEFFGPASDEVTEVRVLAAGEHLSLGQVNQSLEVLLSVLEDHGRAGVPENDPRNGPVMLGIGRALRLQGKPDEALFMLDQAVGILEARHGLSDPALAPPLIEMGHAAPNPSSAVRLYTRARTILERTTGKASLPVAEVGLLIANAQAAQGQQREASATLKETLQALEKLSLTSPSERLKAELAKAKRVQAKFARKSFTNYSSILLPAPDGFLISEYMKSAWYSWRNWVDLLTSMKSS